MICDWFLEKMPWCVEHIGSLSVGWLVTVGVLIWVLIIGAYIALHNAFFFMANYDVSKPPKTPQKRRRRAKRGSWNFLSRDLARTVRERRTPAYLDDNEAFVDDWMDRELWEVTR